MAALTTYACKGQKKTYWLMTNIPDIFHICGRNDGSSSPFSLQSHPENYFGLRFFNNWINEMTSEISAG